MDPNAKWNILSTIVTLILLGFMIWAWYHGKFIVNTINVVEVCNGQLVDNLTMGNITW